MESGVWWRSYRLSMYAIDVFESAKLTGWVELSSVSSGVS